MISPPPIQIATLGWEDSLILMVLALVVFGPRRLPLIGRQIGKLMYEFRKASNDFKFQMEEELRLAEDADRRKKEEAERQRAAALAAESQASVSAPAQTVEAQAAIGAAEAPTAELSDPVPSPPETAAPAEPTALSEPALTVRPPSTGEQVSASERPDYHFDLSETAVAAEVNPEANADANAQAIEAQAAASIEPSTSPVTANGHSIAPSPNPESPTPKEPVSQHG